MVNKPRASLVETWLPIGPKKLALFDIHVTQSTYSILTSFVVREENNYNYDYCLNYNEAIHYLEHSKDPVDVFSRCHCQGCRLADQLKQNTICFDMVQKIRQDLAPIDSVLKDYFADRDNRLNHNNIFIDFLQKPKPNFRPIMSVFEGKNFECVAKNSVEGRLNELMKEDGLVKDLISKDRVKESTKLAENLISKELTKENDLMEKVRNDLRNNKLHCIEFNRGSNDAGLENKQALKNHM